MSYDEVAHEFGYANASGAWKAVQRSLKATQAEKEKAEEYRRLNLERLDALLASVWGRALGGDLRASAVARRIIDSECRLLRPTER